MVVLLAVFELIFFSPSGPLEIGYDDELRLPRVEQICKIKLVAERYADSEYELKLFGFHRSESREYAMGVSELNAVTLAEFLKKLVALPNGVQTHGSDYKSLDNKSGVFVASLSKGSLRSCYCDYDDGLYGELEALATPHLTGEEHVAMVMNGLNWEYNVELLAHQVLPLIEDREVQGELLSALLTRCEVKLVPDRPRSREQRERAHNVLAIGEH